jgi:hypothetical protein
MGSDGGLDVSHEAIKRARTALAEALELIEPGASTRDVRPKALKVHVPQLMADRQALGTWPSAMNFRMSITGAQTGVESTYAQIVTMLDAAVTLLDQAYKNYSVVEGPDAGPTAQA